MKNTRCDDKENCERMKVKIKIDTAYKNKTEDVINHLHTHKDFQSNDTLNKRCQHIDEGETNNKKYEKKNK